MIVIHLVPNQKQKRKKSIIQLLTLKRCRNKLRQSFIIISFKKSFAKTNSNQEIIILIRAAAQCFHLLKRNPLFTGIIRMKLVGLLISLWRWRCLTNCMCRRIPMIICPICLFNVINSFLIWICLAHYIWRRETRMEDLL